MADKDNQDKLAEEWAKALEKDGDAESGQDEEALAAQWSAALKEDPSADKPKAEKDDLADEWAAALAQEEHDKLTQERGREGMSRQGHDYEFKNLTADAKVNQGEKTKRDLDFILDIPLNVSAQLGSTQLLINELLQLGQGSVIELNKLAGEPLEILVNGKLVARGEAVVINEKFGVRLTDIISPIERVKQLA
ncbi:flagellar motor switch protein FliN [Desulfoplanes formicivorans]|uniref:Flagellar motor switch protein FliN n=1 Tax=Desulfoplanes formicivorans TaxID=1592317 RepID=A0A194AH20_9BACT|nr:flagellar motor switch protein FliN [Desulfoplanes formicivorans]GAU08381.1 flagellar motor switch protein FliN [Desulfoplanes formicivorans]